MKFFFLFSLYHISRTPIGQILEKKHSRLLFIYIKLYLKFFLIMRLEKNNYMLENYCNVFLCVNQMYPQLKHPKRETAT